jgi:D-3-phosphoglycerate dehydrogenase
MFKVVRTIALPDAIDIEKKVFGDNIEIVEIPSGTEEELIKNCQDADAVICAYEPFTAKVIDALPNLKLISFKSIGFNYADVEYARSKGLPVMHISQYCIKEVAAYTVGMILALNRRIIQFNKSTHVDKEWKYDLFPDMRRIEEQTVGLLGFGNIPKLVTERLKPFGCKVIAYDPYVDPVMAKEEYNVDLMTMDEVLRQSDIISIHLPANKDTEKIINEETISRMKDGVIFINSARGAVIDEDSVLSSVDSGKFKYYATDVLTDEYPDMKTHPFSERENIILTPHIAFYSQESFRDGVIECAENVKNFLEGNYEKCIRNVVNGVKLQ